MASYAYEWQRCDPGNLTCTPIPGANGQTYTVVAGDLGQRLRVQVTASNPFGHSTAVSNASAVVTNPVVVVTPTLTAARPTTICCQSVRLSGTVSPVRAGEKITILAREFDVLTTQPVASTTTDASGNWSATVTPMIATTYTAQTDTATSKAVTVGVHPRVGFGVNGNTFTAKVTARDNFSGRIAYFQMRTSAGTWHRLALVVINQRSIGEVPRPVAARPHVRAAHLPDSVAGRPGLPRRDEPGPARRRTQVGRSIDRLSEGGGVRVSALFADSRRPSSAATGARSAAQP